MASEDGLSGALAQLSLSPTLLVRALGPALTPPTVLLGDALACAAKGLWDGKCWTNDTATWALYAGETDYNVKNPCCMRYNGGGSQWSRLAVTAQGQSTMKYLLSNPEGRAHYARYIGLLARAVKDHPAAIGIELMNVSPPLPAPTGFVPRSRI